MGSEMCIRDRLRRQAHDVRLAVFEADVNPEPITSAIPALTAPLQIRPPKSENWILIGSLMEDQRRISVKFCSVNSCNGRAKR